MNEMQNEPKLRWSALRGWFPASLSSSRLAMGAVLLLLVAAFAAGRFSALRSAPVLDHDADEAQADQGAESEGEQWYTCSMHPQVRTTDPHERCPICGMELIPVAPGEAEEDSSLPRLAVSPRSAALMQVETSPVERIEVHKVLRLYGRLDYDETRLRTVAAWVPGRLEKLFVDFTGVPVKAGEPMVLIYSPSLIAAQEELLQSVETLHGLPEDYSAAYRTGTEARVEAARDKLRLLGLAVGQIEEIERTGRVEDRLTIPAPVDGVVTERQAAEGLYVQTGQTIYTIADLTHLWVNLEVHERDVEWVRVGQHVSFQIRAFPGETFVGRVAFVQPEVEDRTRTVRVRVDLPNDDGRLKPGMFANGEIHAPLEEADSSMAAGAYPLVIPASAPLLTGRRAVVYVQVPDAERPTFEGREVELGPRAGDFYVVRAGLQEGEQVVTRGNFKIDSELQLRGRPSMMAPTGGMAPVHDHGADLEQEQAAPGRFQVPEAFSEQIGAVVQANFALVKGLSDDSPTAALAAAAAALKALAEVDMSLVGGAAHDSWMISLARQREALGRLASEEDLERMRTHFEPFSDELTRAVRSFGTGSVAPVFRAMCPMVQGRRGYWLQENQEITNPYHGERMYSCGEITETLVELPPSR